MSETEWEIDPVKQLMAANVASSRHLVSSGRNPSNPKSTITKEQSFRGSLNRSEYDTSDDSNVSFKSVSTMSQMTRGAMESAREDLVDEGLKGDGNSNKMAASSTSWICYGLIFWGLLTVCVFVMGFMVSCKSFKYKTADDGVYYYGLRGVTDQTTGRCIDWERQVFLDWDDYWTKDRLPTVSILAIVGVVFVFGTFIAWLGYGAILKLRRNRRKTGIKKESRTGSILPAVVIGIFLIGGGLVVFVSVLGSCSTSSIVKGGYGCNMHTWSALALTASIALCCMGGTLAFCLKCCCENHLTQFLRNELIEH